MNHQDFVPALGEPLGLAIEADEPRDATATLDADFETARLAIASWVSRIVGQRASLLSVPLNMGVGEPMISIAYVKQQTGSPPSSLSTYRALTSDVLDAMQAQGIVVPGYTSQECEWRRKLLCWYEAIPQEQRKEIPIFGNKIKARGYLDKVDSLQGLRSVRGLPLVVITLDEIMDDLRERGYAPDEYRSVKERVSERGSTVTEREISSFDRLASYRDLTVTGVEDLGAWDGEPFSPLLHLFACASLESHSDSGISNYSDAYRFFRDGLISSGFEGHEPLVEMVGTYSLVRFRKYLEAVMIEGKLTSHTSNTLLSCARRMMSVAKEISGVLPGPFIAAPGFEASAETDSYRPYSPAERSRISRVIAEAMAKTNALNKPPILSGLGEDPLGPSGKIKVGGKTPENARWIFENKLGCTPIGFKTGDKADPYQKAFLAIVGAQGASIDSVYESWGVLYSRDSHMLTPYLARLAQVTGLNADSLLSLNVGDFEERHPLTNRPCLRYWKERSTGAKEYHLDIFLAEISWLTTSQAKEVKKIFDDVKALTVSFRHLATSDDSEKLFIFRSSSPRMYNQIKSLEGAASTITGKMFDQFSKKYGLLDDNGESLRLSPARFRPSFVSELVERGVSLREVQVVLGHKSLRTTIGYLERLDLNRVARGILNEALAKIHANTLASERVVEVGKTQASDENDIIFRTPFGACKNIFNPPEFIKKLKGYVPGKPCALYNKCLSCDNRLITVAHLPDLFAMRRDYLNMLDVSRIIDTPYGVVVLENLALLEGILDPNVSDFSQAELDEAQRLSEYVETNIIVEGVAM